MAGTYMKKAGAWQQISTGPTGIGTFGLYVKKGGVWVQAYGASNVAASIYVKKAGVWVTEFAI